MPKWKRLKEFRVWCDYSRWSDYIPAWELCEPVKGITLVANRDITDPLGWRISEKRTGMTIMSSTTKRFTTRESALQSAIDRIAPMSEEFIEDQVTKRIVEQVTKQLGGTPE